MSPQADAGPPPEGSAPPPIESQPGPPRGISAVEAAQKQDEFESSTSQWLRRQAALLELDAYRYLTPETENEGLARIRRELEAGREVVPARILYRLALQMFYQARRGATGSVWEEGMYLMHNL